VASAQKPPPGSRARVGEVAASGSRYAATGCCRWGSGRDRGRSGRNGVCRARGPASRLRAVGEHGRSGRRRAGGHHAADGGHYHHCRGARRTDPHLVRSRAPTVPRRCSCCPPAPARCRRACRTPRDLSCPAEVSPRRSPGRRDCGPGVGDGAAVNAEGLRRCRHVARRPVKEYREADRDVAHQHRHPI
jgi:hypothetical protein